MREGVHYELSGWAAYPDFDNPIYRDLTVPPEMRQPVPGVYEKMESSTEERERNARLVEEVAKSIIAHTPEEAKIKRIIQSVAIRIRENW
jgi:membrane-bound ClpP family serine protease